MRVAITGASGGLGRYVVQEMLAAGHQVYALDRTLPATDVPSRLIDIRDLGQVCGALRDCDAVLHLAAIPSPVGHPPEEVFAINALGTFNVLEAAIKRNTNCNPDRAPLLAPADVRDIRQSLLFWCRAHRS